jgi:hypothetical protein
MDAVARRGVWEMIGEAKVAALSLCIFAIISAPALSAPLLTAPSDVLTERGNNERTSAFIQPGLNQSVFTPAWRQLGALAVQGTVYAQPLFVAGLTMALDNRTHNVVFVATAQNNVYAFDADTFVPLWPQRPIHLGGSDKSEVADEGGNRLGCNNLSEPNGQKEGIGTEATPVIDRKLGRMFVSYRLGDADPDNPPDPAKAKQMLAAIDISTGNLVGPPITVEPPSPPPDWPKWNRSRASLLLVDGVVYVAFASRCEDPGTQQFQGWVLAYDALSLRRVGCFNPASNCAQWVALPDQPSVLPLGPALDGAGIWQGSVGPAADENGDIYIMTGNRRVPPICPNPGNSPYDSGGPDAVTGNLSESFIRLKPAIARDAQGSVMGVQFSIADWFTPYRRIWMDAEDMDLGASGVVLIPGTPFLFGGGKEGLIYLIDRDHMGGLDPGYWKFADYCNLTVSDTDDTSPDDPARDRVRQKFPAGKNQNQNQNQYPNVPSPHMIHDMIGPRHDMIEPRWLEWPHIHGAPAFARFGSFAALYVWPEKDHPKSFRWLDSSRFDTTPVKSALLAPPFGSQNSMPGGMISVAVDPTKPDSGVVFAAAYSANSGPDGVLHALDPVSLKELWHSAPYDFVKFVPPTIADNKVFLPTAISPPGGDPNAGNEVLVFGARWPAVTMAVTVTVYRTARPAH